MQRRHFVILVIRRNNFNRDEIVTKERTVGQSVGHTKKWRKWLCRTMVRIHVWWRNGGNTGAPSGSLYFSDLAAHQQTDGRLPHKKGYPLRNLQKRILQNKDNRSGRKAKTKTHRRWLAASLKNGKDVNEKKRSETQPRLFETITLIGILQFKKRNDKVDQILSSSIKTTYNHVLNLWLAYCLRTS